MVQVQVGPPQFKMAEWILVIFIHGTTDYDIFGVYTRLESCQHTISFLEKRYSIKREPFKAECWPVAATFKDVKPIPR